MTEGVEGSVVPINIEQEIKTSFLDYSMSVIVSRALPDIRDGLKPVHRRILFAMFGLKNFHNKPYLKSARVVGDVIGKYHPHGDLAVYDALVRLAQDFSMRYPLIDGQGNFGSIDGDSAASHRYTEARLQEYSEFLLNDLDKDTVDFTPNYDNKDFEPTVLPAQIPQLMVNGASGIAVGMATNIPPHNLGEVLAGLRALILNADITIDELMQHVKGPDFPTSGEIHGTSGIREAYHTGRGSIVVRAKALIEDMGKSSDRQRIVVTEIPYQVNKARLIEKIAELVREKKIEGIADLRDESAKNEIRIAIDLKKGEPAQIILNNLYKLTAMQSSFGVNMLALVNGMPRQLNLKEMLQEFYYHRREVVARRTAHLLKKCEERAHLLVGLKAAIENADQVVELIRGAKDSQTAQAELMERFSLSELQAKAILDMRLARLTGLEREKIVFEYENLIKEIAEYNNILNSPERVTQIILDEFAVIEEKFGDARRTSISHLPGEDLTMEQLIADDAVMVTLTHAGYIKRTSIDEIAAQKRGGKGRSGVLMKEEDFVQNVFITSNHQNLLCFTTKGRVYNLKVYQLPEANLRTKGRHLANLISFEEGERVVSVLPVAKFTTGLYIYSVTSKGYIKKSDLMSYANVRSSGIIGLKLESDESLINCALGDDNADVLIATKQGKAIRFPGTEVRAMGRVSRGVTGIRFGQEDDLVIGMEILSKKEDTTVLSVCENGYGKRSPLEEYRLQSRGGKGIYTIKVTERNGPVVGIAQVTNNDDLMIITSAGKLTRFTIKELGVIGRHTQGVRLMNVATGEKVISLSKVVNDPEDAVSEEASAGSGDAQ
jgi:DNA gyrase subunit A